MIDTNFDVCAKANMLENICAKFQADSSITY